MRDPNLDELPEEPAELPPIVDHCVVCLAIWEWDTSTLWNDRIHRHERYKSTSGWVCWDCQHDMCHVCDRLFEVGDVMAKEGKRGSAIPAAHRSCMDRRGAQCGAGPVRCLDVRVYYDWDRFGDPREDPRYAQASAALAEEQRAWESPRAVAARRRVPLPRVRL